MTLHYSNLPIWWNSMSHKIKVRKVLLNNSPWRTENKKKLITTLKLIYTLLCLKIDWLTIKSSFQGQHNVQVKGHASGYVIFAKRHKNGKKSWFKATFTSEMLELTASHLLAGDFSQPRFFLGIFGVQGLGFAGDLGVHCQGWKEKCLWVNLEWPNWHFNPKVTYL